VLDNERASAASLGRSREKIPSARYFDLEKLHIPKQKEGIREPPAKTIVSSENCGSTAGRPRTTALQKGGIEGGTWHTFASRLGMAGVDLKTVQELMGQKTIAMTARYAHLAPTHKLQALETLVRRGSVSVESGYKIGCQRQKGRDDFKTG